MRLLNFLEYHLNLFRVPTDNKSSKGILKRDTDIRSIKEVFHDFNV